MLSSFTFQRLLYRWSEQNPRDYPWIQEKNPYKIWISEVLLQQTRSDQAKGHYLSFLETFPTLKNLAEAKEDRVMHQWKGLGYYSRARNLHKTAKIIAEQHHSIFPSDPAIIKQLPGIGPYTLAAISSFAFGIPLPVIDGNVIRVLSRISGLTESPYSKEGKKRIEQLAQNYIDQANPGVYNQAIMNFGATHCRPNKPLCTSCPFSNKCIAYLSDCTDSIPLPKKRNTLKKRYFHYIIVRDKTKRVGIHKRTKKDIWFALYEFPMIETKTKRISKEKLHEFVIDVSNEANLKPVLSLYSTTKSKLSHQEIHCSFYEIKNLFKRSQIKAEFSFEKPENLANFAFPSPILNFIKHYFKN